MSDIKKLTDEILKFRERRNWKQFHNPKDLAISLSLEASEVLEHFQWKNGEEMENYSKANKEHIGEELMDVLYWTLLLSYDLGIDVTKAFMAKMKKNDKKYPVKKSKGSHKKYTEL